MRKLPFCALRSARASSRETAVPTPALDRAPIAHVAINTGVSAGEIVVLVARATDDGGVDVLGAIANDARLASRALAALD